MAHSRSGVIVLLGAGVSVDAGMPTVPELSGELIDRLEEVESEFLGSSAADVRALCRQIGAVDPTTRANYEHLFAAMAIRRDPFTVGRLMAATAAAFSVGIGALVERVLCGRHGRRRHDPSRYLAGLTQVNVRPGPLGVFSLNYDLCVEDACCLARIPITTGFSGADPSLWDESYLDSATKGIVLHKLHGSLSWRPHPSGGTAVEVDWRDPEAWQLLLESRCELVLGPGDKRQRDAPFAPLFRRFGDAAARAAACVVIGYAYGDDHINRVLVKEALDELAVFDVRPPNGNDGFATGLVVPAHRRIPHRAKDALQGNMLIERLRAEGFA